MVQILSMMEQDVVGGEQEIQTLKETLKALNARNELQEKDNYSTTVMTALSRYMVKG